MSHDLKSPLQAISLSVASLIRRSHTPDPLVPALRRVLSATERAQRMIRDLLDFTQARQGGGIRVVPVPVDLHRLVCQVTDELEASQPEKRIRLRQYGKATGI
ncbi:MAG TPA: histidine kinase dimerization/phospho-acceptor domain-containing protein [Myxococcaceae bacterium]|nr:histidine kinase dimerization/phospho-acceptor domain-containing protein [Myxococcaceae bacterium]